jgi:hypothetical protein
MEAGVSCDRLRDHDNGYTMSIGGALLNGLFTLSIPLPRHIAIDHAAPYGQKTLVPVISLQSLTLHTSILVS